MQQSIHSFSSVGMAFIDLAQSNTSRDDSATRQLQMVLQQLYSLHCTVYSVLAQLSLTSTSSGTTSYKRPPGTWLPPGQWTSSVQGKLDRTHVDNPGHVADGDSDAASILEPYAESLIFQEPLTVKSSSFNANSIPVSNSGLSGARFGFEHLADSAYQCEYVDTDVSIAEPVSHGGSPFVTKISLGSNFNSKDGNSFTCKPVAAVTERSHPALLTDEQVRQKHFWDWLCNTPYKFATLTDADLHVTTDQHETEVNLQTLHDHCREVKPECSKSSNHSATACMHTNRGDHNIQLSSLNIDRIPGSNLRDSEFFDCGIQFCLHCHEIMHRHGRAFCLCCSNLACCSQFKDAKFEDTGILVPKVKLRTPRSKRRKRNTLLGESVLEVSVGEQRSDFKHTFCLQRGWCRC